jgi:hypothetical protein
MAEEAKSDSRDAPTESGDGNGREHDAAGKREQGMVTAPSLGPNTVIDREPVEERLARHEQSEVDAMGKDKRRSVVGRRHGPSKARQLGLYGASLAVIAALVIGAIILIGSFDKSVGKVHEHGQAQWSKPGVKQIQPKPIQ